MIREQILNHVFVSDDYEWTEWIFGHDQAYNGAPVVFPTVGIDLMETTALDALADDMRESEGCRTFFKGQCKSGCEHCNNDCGAWYRFMISLNGYTDSHIDNAIQVVCENMSELDDMETFTIDLTADEQEYVYQCIDRDLREMFDVGCEDILKECARREKPYCGGELTIRERVTA